MNLYPVTIVDNFYDNPDAIRKFALEQKFMFRHEEKNIEFVYPGCRTTDLSVLNKALYEKVCKKLVSVLHIAEYDYMRFDIRTSFQIVSEEYGRGVIHSDHNTIFAAVVYLTPNAPLNSGTSLFKKNKTFIEEKYLTFLDQNDENFRTGNKVMDTSYHSMFDEIVTVNNIYNTLIIYEGDIFHAANNFFGTTLQDSRLAQVFFITKINANKTDSFPLNRTKAIKI